MTIVKANAKEYLGEFICLSITKAKAKYNFHFQAKGDGGKGTGKKMSRQFATNVTAQFDIKRHKTPSQVTAQAVWARESRVGAGPSLSEPGAVHCAEVRPSPRGECELTISEESFKATPLSER